MEKSELPPTQIIQKRNKKGTTFEIDDKDLEDLCRIITGS